jgi:hypothetical protein
MKHQVPNSDDVNHPDTAELANFQRLLRPYSVQARDLAKQMPDWHSQSVAPSRAVRYLSVGAAVLALGMAACVGFLMLRLQWTPGAAWPVHGDRQQSQLQRSEPLITGPGEHVNISVARIGSLQLASNSALELLQTGPAEHRVRLLYGQMRARIWAPPNWFGVSVGHAEVVDLGCDFEVQKAREGTGSIRVYSGWIAYRVADVELLVPAGHVANFDRNRITTPVSVAASKAFLSDIGLLEHNIAVGNNDPGAELRVAANARDDDRFSLLSLLTRYPQLASGPIYQRLAGALDVDANDLEHRKRWLKGDQAAINRWWQRLPNQPKHWWWNWSDVL